MHLQGRYSTLEEVCSDEALLDQTVIFLFHGAWYKRLPSETLSAVCWLSFSTVSNMTLLIWKQTISDPSVKPSNRIPCTIPILGKRKNWRSHLHPLQVSGKDTGRYGLAFLVPSRRNFIKMPGFFNSWMLCWTLEFFSALLYCLLCVNAALIYRFPHCQTNLE